MSTDKNRPNAGSEGAEDEDREDGESYCDDLNATSLPGQLSPPLPDEILIPGSLPGFESIQETTDLTLEELPSGYQSAIRRLRIDRDRFAIFEKVAFSQLHKHPSTSADKIEGVLRDAYRIEFCHFSRTLMGRLFQWKYPHFAERIKTKCGILDTLDSAIKEELVRITQ